MFGNVFGEPFGERVEGYNIPVLNEREVRAGAGILFFIALTVFLGAWHADVLLPAQMMIAGFFIDFLIRVINPRYAPSLVLGRIAVSQQTPEYTAAAPKRFAWFIGLGLAAVMVVTLLFLHNMSVLNFAICAVCIVLLFLESSFGICLGCVVYHQVLGRNLQLCPGNVCEVRPKEAIQQISWPQLGALALFALAMYGVLLHLRAEQQAHPHHGPNHPMLQQWKESLQAPAPVQAAPPHHQHH